MRLEDFLENVFTRQPFSLPDRARSLGHLLTWDVVREVIEAKRSVLRIIKDGKMVLDDAAVGFDEAMAYYRDGCTLLLRYAERSHAGLKALADDFAQGFNTPVDIQAYCTPAGEQAFLWHYDVEEVFVVQTLGAKAYEIRPNTVHPNPLINSIPDDLKYEKEKTPLKAEALISEGDWLYIPSGWWHIARTRAESMHLSVGMMPVANIKLIDFLAQALAHDPVWRMRVPRHIPDDAEEKKYYGAMIQSLSKSLTRFLDSEEARDKFIAFVKGTSAPASPRSSGTASDVQELLDPPSGEGS